MLNKLKPAPGSRRKPTRKGRGISAGKGKTAGRGHIGQKQRSGVKLRPGFEGGQMPLYRRIPKRGFHNVFRKEFAVVNLEQLNSFPAGAEITPDSLKEAGIIKKTKNGVKVLGKGQLDKALTVKAHAWSRSAREKIEAAGGKVEVV